MLSDSYKKIVIKEYCKLLIVEDALISKTLEESNTLFEPVS